MTNPNKTDITYIIDRSGSMAKIWPETIDGLRDFVEAQKTLPGYCNFTLVAFDHKYEVHKYGNIKDLTTYKIGRFLYPRGSTALYYAIKKTIDEKGKELAALPEEERPGKVIICITTDGKNNVSRGVYKEDAARVIKHQEEKYNWEVIYTGIGVDVSEDAVALNVKYKNTANFEKSFKGMNETYLHVGQTVANYRSK